MPRITTSSSIRVFAAATVVFLGVVGCSDEYEHRRVNADDARSEEVREMIAALRSADGDELSQRIRAQALDELHDHQFAALRDVLEEVAAAERAELMRMDRFGRDVYRATIELSDDAGRTRQVSMLLVPRDRRLRWAKKN